MKFTLVPISERLPTAEHFKHPLDSVVFYDNNGVKFLFKKKKGMDETKEGILAIGFTHWLEEG